MIKALYLYSFLYLSGHPGRQPATQDYGREQADVIKNIVGNIAVGQVSGDTAKQLSEQIGKIMQDGESLSINISDISVSKSKQLEAAAPHPEFHCIVPESLSVCYYTC
jgi:hypothetical protein